MSGAGSVATFWLPHGKETVEYFRRVSMFKDRQFDQSVIPLCVRWYVAYNMSLRDLKEMVERGIAVDHTTIHRWTIRYSPLLLERFNRRKHGVTGKWHVDETYIKVRGQWMYLYRAIDSVGDTSSFLASIGISLRQSASSTRRWSAMAARIASSSMAARPTGRRSVPATRQIACRIVLGAS
jgi:DDE domain